MITLETKHLKKEYGNVQVIRDVSLQFQEGEVAVLIGPSGCGKSTILRMLNMLEKPTSGQILYKGKDISAPGVNLEDVRKEIGMITQHYTLFDNMTVLENLCFAPVHFKMVKPKEMYEIAMASLQEEGLAHLAYKYPSELSGGQRQRIAAYRMLLMSPQVYLGDEPTSAYDPQLVDEFIAYVRGIVDGGRKNTIVFVTHDLYVAEKIADKIYYIDEGVVYESGTPEQIFHHPQKIKTKAFIERFTAFDREITTKDINFTDIYEELNEFAYNNRVYAKTLRHIQAILEELLSQIMLPRFIEGKSKINFRIERFSDMTHSTIQFYYTGLGDINVDDEHDKLPWAIIKYHSNDISFSKENDKNVITIAVTENELITKAYDSLSIEER